jgi:hypothetical protein
MERDMASLFLEPFDGGEVFRRFGSENINPQMAPPCSAVADGCALT